MTDKLQVQTVTTLKFVAAHVSAKLGTLVSAAKFTQQRLQFSQALTEDWKNITKKLAGLAVLFFSLSE